MLHSILATRSITAMFLVDFQMLWSCFIVASEISKLVLIIKLTSFGDTSIPSATTSPFSWETQNLAMKSRTSLNRRGPLVGGFIGVSGLCSGYSNTLRPGVWRRSLLSSKPIPARSARKSSLVAGFGTLRIGRSSRIVLVEGLPDVKVGHWNG